MNFKEYLHLAEFTLSTPLGISIPSAIPFGAVSGSWAGNSDPTDAALPLRSGGFIGTPNFRSDFNLGLPSTRKTARITFINEKRDPILVCLSDGTKLYMPCDAYKRLNIEPEVGRTMEVVFQRRSDNDSMEPSKIESITIH